MGMAKETGHWVWEKAEKFFPLFSSNTAVITFWLSSSLHSVNRGLKSTWLIKPGNEERQCYRPQMTKWPHGKAVANQACAAPHKAPWEFEKTIFNFRDSLPARCGRGQWLNIIGIGLAWPSFKHFFASSPDLWWLLYVRKIRGKRLTLVLRQKPRLQNFPSDPAKQFLHSKIKIACGSN